MILRWKLNLLDSTRHTAHASTSFSIVRATTAPRTSPTAITNRSGAAGGRRMSVFVIAQDWGGGFLYAKAGEDSFQDDRIGLHRREVLKLGEVVRWPGHLRRPRPKGLAV